MKLEIDDCFFVSTVQDIHSDGDTPVQRFRQADGRRFTVREEAGWLFFKARREIMVPRSNVKHMVPMTAERAKILGPNPYDDKPAANDGKASK